MEKLIYVSGAIVTFIVLLTILYLKEMKGYFILNIEEKELK